MKAKKRNRGITELKSRYGRIFVLPWVIDIIIFFLIPLAQSVIFSFSEISIAAGSIKTDILGMEHYKEILYVDPNYTVWLKNSVTSFLYSLPIIILISIVLALLLNQKFRGRLFFRALYFLPVIISTGAIMNLIFQTTSNDLSGIGVSESYSASMFSVEDIIGWLGLNGQIGEYISLVISKIFDLVWSCGIQTVLFLAGLQSVPASLYEASRVEGATKWEEFWFITFPMLSRVTLLVAVFTMVELITNERTEMVKQVYGMMRSGIYDKTSAMLWFYFLVNGALMGFVVFLYNRFLMKRWEA